MNSSSNVQNSKSRCHTPVRKTAVVHPFGWSSQRSFSGTKQANDNTINEAAFSSLPTIFVPKGKNQNENRGPCGILRDKIQQKRSLIKETTTSNRRVSSSWKQESEKVIVLTKPFLDHIEDLCSGASYKIKNCDRKKINHEQRRKSLSKERLIGIKQFYKYSTLWGQRKELFNVKKD